MRGRFPDVGIRGLHMRAAHVLLFSVREDALPRFAATASDAGGERNAAAQALQRFPERMRDHSHATETTSLFARLMAIVASQLGEVHFGQGENVIALLRAPLHASLRVDVQKLEPRHAFPFSRKIAEEHLLQMLAIKIHPIEDAVAAKNIEKLLAANSNPAATAVHD